jgi:hypothetical protein
LLLLGNSQSKACAKMTDTSDPRLIMFHKQGTSARTRFLLLDSGTVCGFEPLPRLAEVIDHDFEASESAASNVAFHPGALVHGAETRLGLSAGSLEAIGDFHARVDVAGGPVSVYLAAFTTQDPPFSAAESIGGSFIELPEARMLPPTELQLLRLAYEYLFGG